MSYPRRIHYRTDFLEPDGVRIVAERHDANLISSRVDYLGTHWPVIDLDYHADLIGSTTAGHFHLYLDKSVTWYRYRRVLKALAAAGLIERGFYRAALRRRATFVRPLWVKKLETDADYGTAPGDWKFCRKLWR